MVREKGSCKLAVKHSQCKPGEYIQQKGTDVLICGVDVLKRVHKSLANTTHKLHAY